MKQQLIQQAQQEIADLEAKKRKAQATLKTKRSRLFKEVHNDTPDLFGERTTDSPEKLFNPPVCTKAIDKSLEPIRAEILDYDRQLDKWTKDLMRLVNMEESDLFSQQKVA